jgi:hypothetical protein
MVHPFMDREACEACADETHGEAERYRTGVIFAMSMIDSARAGNAFSAGKTGGFRGLQRYHRDSVHLTFAAVSI